MPTNYWMIISNLENFRITRELGFKTQGLKTQHQRKVQRIEPGDRILLYVSGERRFAATVTATSKYFEDRSPIWKDEGSTDWGFRIHIKPGIVLDEAEFMDACQLAPRLDYVRRWAPEDWYMAFAQSNLHLLPKRDFGLVEDEMRKIKGDGPLGPRETRHGFDGRGDRGRRNGTPRPAGTRPGPQRDQALPR